jgi:Anti-sigma factor NepR
VREKNPRSPDDKRQDAGAIRTVVGDRLNGYYRHLVHEPLPERLAELLRRLEDLDKRQ